MSAHSVAPDGQRRWAAALGSHPVTVFLASSRGGLRPANTQLGGGPPRVDALHTEVVAVDVHSGGLYALPAGTLQQGRRSGALVERSEGALWEALPGVADGGGGLVHAAQKGGLGLRGSRAAVVLPVLDGRTPVLALPASGGAASGRPGRGPNRIPPPPPLPKLPRRRRPPPSPPSSRLGAARPAALLPARTPGRNAALRAAVAAALVVAASTAVVWRRAWPKHRSAALKPGATTAAAAPTPTPFQPGNTTQPGEPARGAPPVPAAGSSRRGKGRRRPIGDPAEPADGATAVAPLSAEARSDSDWISRNGSSSGAGSGPGTLSLRQLSGTPTEGGSGQMSGALRVGRLLVGPGTLGFGSLGASLPLQHLPLATCVVPHATYLHAGTIVFDGRLDGRPVAVKRMLLQFHELARCAFFWVQTGAGLAHLSLRP